MEWFFKSNDTAARLLRTVVQGVIAAVIAWLTTIAPDLPEIVSLLVIPVVMAILSPIMGVIGSSEKDEGPVDATVGGTTDD